ncbi:Pyrazinamidase/nicotinamidase [Spironucleus salmonicida]|uniref:nicotinamidase n=1 Tax=Spironucleus salmonicida TaxID=348837 RepID=V6LCN0_9EUKA|nr:Pyrazinamidase/nicotinamidase [Spironucleus salmonicida]KAH0574691.1 Pyrazinamidase/nicotinamidase [Spironucleus salmonicida]|eukprot:EST42202.1 Pyrazinamidase/nicotinamidase [Spironucleus salmonicida]
MTCLIIVDLQNDFLPGGSLPTIEDARLVAMINAAQPDYDYCVATRDWHPPAHQSFEAVPGICIDATPESIQWPAHCVQGTHGAAFAPGLAVPEHVFSKGQREDVEAFSGFQSDGLARFVQSRNVHRIDVVGLALEFCVKATALDALKYATEVRVLTGLTGRVFPDSAEEVARELRAAGVVVI